MTPVAVIAAGAISALGAGEQAYSVGRAGERPHSVIARDPALEAAGLRRPFAARVALETDESDRARMLLEQAAHALAAELDRELPGWRELRVGIALGTSSGGMPSLEAVFDARARGVAIDADLARAAPYFGPLAGLAALFKLSPTRVTQVFAACASSTLALGIGCRWLEAAHCDLVIAGGYDALTLFVAAGFEALRATTATLPRPFRQARDGMALGEGAALVALAREPGRANLGYILGFGASCDAVHVTAPDRTGSGLARAASAALADAGSDPDAIDLVSAHATATVFNDAAEAHAIERALGPAAARAVVHPFKGVIGHTLGAAGALETLAALDACHRGILPAACGEGEVEPLLSARLLAVNAPGKIRSALKLSTAFGGTNAALVVAPQRPSRPSQARPRRRARLRAIGEAETAVDVTALLTQRTSAKNPALELSRLDLPSALALAACDQVLRSSGVILPDPSGIVVGTATATLEVNAVFAARLREFGASAAEPRRFPATSPNLCAGRAAIAWGLHGPVLGVGAGLCASIEALLLAVDLLEAGDAEAVLVVALEDVGPVVQEVWRAAGWALPEHGALAAILDCGTEGVALDSERIISLKLQAERQDGALNGARAGWPAFKKALLSCPA